METPKTDFLKMDFSKNYLLNFRPNRFFAFHVSRINTPAEKIIETSFNNFHCPYINI